MTRLTDGPGGTIAKAKVPEKGSAFIYDESQHAPMGFGLRITQAGGKIFILRYGKADGKRRIITIGRWDTWSLSAARARAGELRREIDAGGDPLDAKRRTTEETKNTFSALVDQFDRQHLAKRRYGPQVRRFLDRLVIPHWGEKSVSTITRRDVLDLLDGIVASGTPTTANRVLAAVRKFFNWCVERDVLDKAPSDGVKAPAEERARDRVLSDDEIRWLWAAAEQIGPPFGPFAQVLLLTGQRLREVAEMTTAEIQGDVWTIPAQRAKNKREHCVPLTDLAWTELARLNRPQDSIYYFTTTGRTPISGFRPGVERLRKAMVEIASKEAGKPVEIPHWTFHDLRRTAATGLARLGTPIHVTEAILNHKSGTVSGIAAVYNRYNYAEEKRDCLDRWAKHVSRVVSSDPHKPLVKR